MNVLKYYPTYENLKKIWGAIGNLQKQISSGGSSIPSGTDRQVLGYDEDGNPESVNLSWKQFSDQPNPPEFTLGTLVYNSELPEGNQFGFGELSQDALPFTIPIRDEDGNFKGSIPESPTTGTYVLKSINGVLTWEEEI